MPQIPPRCSIALLTAVLLVILGSPLSAKDEKRFAHGPCFSPDGASLVYSTNWNHENYSLFLVGVDGKGRRNLTDGRTTDGEADWFPDGKSLVFCRKVGEDWALFRLDLASGEAEPLYQARRSLAPAVSPSGAVIAFEGREGENNDIYLLDVATGKETRLTEDEANDFSPSWSPDGSRIVFSSKRGGTYDLWTIDVAGGAPERVTDDGGHEANPIWAGDGGHVLYTHIEGEDQEVRLLDLASGKSRTISASSPHDGACDISPDGTTVAFVVNVDGGTAIAVEPTAGGPRKLVSRH